MKDLKYTIKYFKSARVIFCDKDANAVDETYKYALNGIWKGLRFFLLPQGFPLINLFIAPDREEYDRMVSHLTKIPTSKGRLGQPQGHDFYLIAPNAWPTDVHPDYLGPDGACDKKVYRQFIEHEIVHMIEEYSSPKNAMEIRPQWWGDGIAVYATGQYGDRINREEIKKDLAVNKLPHITGMKGRDAYVWGWSLVRYIEKRFGRKILRKIILESCTEDILGFLKLRKNKFELEWRAAILGLGKEATLKGRK
ncbi:MAG: hypothetical protein Q8O90_06635 [Elusimicrobiota bacterium]|nr:hypothetical protein [Elusimicrobiota bacterium]